MTKPGPETPPHRHGYFAVQATTDLAGPEPRTHGVVENLVTGEKTPFRSPGELGEYVLRWAESQRTPGSPADRDRRPPSTSLGS